MVGRINNIPEELLSSDAREGDVSILIGENGSGKSQMLAHLTRNFGLRGKRVIAVSNSIHDKFPDSGRDLHLLRDRSGRKKTKRSIKNALLNISPEDITRLKNASEALSFVGYDPVIGIEKISVSVSDIEQAVSRERIRNRDTQNDKNQIITDDIYKFGYDYEIEELISLIRKLDSFQSENIIWLSLTDYSFAEINRSSFLLLLRWENTLKRLNLIDSFHLFLRKDDNAIPLFDASSGELSFISTLVYLSTTIDDNSVILIDEPENSLHPSWQKDYIKILLQLFYLYQPKVVVATHSALVVTGAEASNQSTNIYECKNFQFIKRELEPINIEAAFLSFFNVVTPENRFLSDLMIDWLNKLAERQLPYDELDRRLNRLLAESFDERQKNVLEGVKEIAFKIVNQNN